MLSFNLIIPFCRERYCTNEENNLERQKDIFFTHFAREKKKNPSRVEWDTGTTDAKTRLKIKTTVFFCTSYARSRGNFKGYFIYFKRKLLCYLTLLSKHLETHCSFLLKNWLVPLNVPFPSPKLCGRHGSVVRFPGWTTPTAQVRDLATRKSRLPVLFCSDHTEDCWSR